MTTLREAKKRMFAATTLDALSGAVAEVNGLLRARAQQRFEKRLPLEIAKFQRRTGEMFSDAEIERGLRRQFRAAWKAYHRAHKQETDRILDQFLGAAA